MEGMTISDEFLGDYDTPEQRIGGFNRAQPWESCITICRQWAWKPDDRMKSRKECLQTMLHVIGGDGNLLLNVGPQPDGRIEPRQVDRLKEMGNWLQAYGDGIYGTRGGPFKPGTWGASTCKGNRIFLFVMQWPTNGPLRLPPVARSVKSSRTLTGGKAQINQSDAAIEISLDAADRDEIASIVELTVDGDAFQIEPIAVDKPN
jgi:alpha-L-fucosidase